MRARRHRHHDRGPVTHGLWGCGWRILRGRDVARKARKAVAFDHKPVQHGNENHGGQDRNETHGLTGCPWNFWKEDAP
ncbi:hypothetical protein AL037_03205 [Salipiger aestuarii]|nr:hypothetical protein C357_13997 [Citreicella sp. 357]KAA8615214.1 hypothetical protein AL037_03205 [Salipiger aestuarii]